MSRNLAAEVQFQREQVGRLLAKTEIMRAEALASDPEFERLVALGGVLHSFYVGIEGIFVRIARELDGGVPTGEAWHQGLLLLMARDGSKRGPVITSELTARLQGFLSFRHVFRSHYGFELDWGLMRPLVAELPEIVRDLDRAFVSFLRDILNQPRSA